MPKMSNLFPPRVMELSNGKKVIKPRSKTPLILLLVLIFTFISVEITGFNFETLFRRGNQFWVILGDMLPPNVNFWKSIWPLLLDTIKMSLFGSVMGAIVALPVAILASQNIVHNLVITSIFKTFLSILRTLPTLISALVATYIFGIGTMAGMVAIFLFSLAYVGKLLYEQIESVDMGAFEAMESIGYTKFYAFRYAVFPEVLPSYLSTTLFNFEGNVRYASILGYVGAGGIGMLLNERLGWRDYPSVGMILLALFVTVYLIETVSEYFRNKLN